MASNTSTSSIPHCLTSPFIKHICHFFSTKTTVATKQCFCASTVATTRVWSNLATSATPCASDETVFGTECLPPVPIVAHRPMLQCPRPPRHATNRTLSPTGDGAEETRATGPCWAASNGGTGAASSTTATLVQRPSVPVWFVSRPQT